MRQSSGNRHNQQHASGFSLLELLLVLGLLTVAMAITVPALSRWQRRLPLERSAALLQQALSETRLASIQSGEPWGLWLYASGTQGRRTPLNQPDLDRYQFQFPQGIACRPAPVDGQPAQEGAEDLVLIFQPDGSSSSARLLLINERGEELHIVLERLTGNAEIRPALSAFEKSATPDVSTKFVSQRGTVRQPQNIHNAAASWRNLVGSEHIKSSSTTPEFEPWFLLLNRQNR